MCEKCKIVCGACEKCKSVCVCGVFVCLYVLDGKILTACVKRRCGKTEHGCVVCVVFFCFVVCCTAGDMCAT